MLSEAPRFIRYARMNAVDKFCCRNFFVLFCRCISLLCELDRSGNEGATLRPTVHSESISSERLRTYRFIAEFIYVHIDVHGYQDSRLEILF